MMYNHVSDVDIVSDLQNSQLRTHQTSQLTKSHSENVLITSFLGYKTLDSNVMETSIIRGRASRWPEASHSHNFS